MTEIFLGQTVESTKKKFDQTDTQETHRYRVYDAVLRRFYLSRRSDLLSSKEFLSGIYICIHIRVCVCEMEDRGELSVKPKRNRSPQRTWHRVLSRGVTPRIIDKTFISQCQESTKLFSCAGLAGTTAQPNEKEGTCWPQIPLREHYAERGSASQQLFRFFLSFFFCCFLCDRCIVQDSIRYLLLPCTSAQFSGAT